MGETVEEGADIDADIDTLRTDIDIATDTIADIDTFKFHSVKFIKIQ